MDNTHKKRVMKFEIGNFFIYCIVHWVGVSVKYADFEKFIKIMYEIPIVRLCGSTTVSNLTVDPTAWILLF